MRLGYKSGKNKVRLAMKETTKILYRGAVSFSHSLVWLGVLGITFGSIYFALPPLIEMFNGDFVFPSIVELSAITFSIGIVLPVLLLVIKLKFQVREDGIYLKIIPFKTEYKRILWKDIATYKPYEHVQKEVNQLGLRYTISGKSYGLGGKRGLQIDLVNGDSIFIESRKPDKIIEVIKSVSHKIN